MMFRVWDFCGSFADAVTIEAPNELEAARAYLRPGEESINVYVAMLGADPMTARDVVVAREVVATDCTFEGTPKLLRQSIERPSRYPAVSR